MMRGVKGDMRLFDGINEQRQAGGRVHTRALETLMSIHEIEMMLTLRRETSYKIH
jgi:hypothetical protein